jgi:hypothetical protein
MKSGQRLTWRLYNTARSGSAVRVCLLTVGSGDRKASSVGVVLMELSVTAIDRVLLFDISIELNIAIDLIVVRMKDKLNVWRLRYECLRSIDFAAVEAYCVHQDIIRQSIDANTERSALHLHIIIIYFVARNSILLKDIKSNFQFH